MRGAGAPGGEVQHGMTEARNAHVTVSGRSRGGVGADSTRATDATAPVAIRMAVAPARRHPVD